MGPPTPAVDCGGGAPGGVGSRGGGLPSPGGNMLPLSPSVLEAGEKEQKYYKPQQTWCPHASYEVLHIFFQILWPFIM